MSAYGKIAAPKNGSTTALPTLLLALPTGNQLVVAHVQSPASSHAPQALLTHLHALFNAVLLAGNTYPQEGPMEQAEFDGYFGGGDLFIGIVVASSFVMGDQTGIEALALARGGRGWSDCVGGMNYVSGGTDVKGVKVKRAETVNRSSQITRGGPLTFATLALWWTLCSGARRWGWH